MIEAKNNQNERPSITLIVFGVLFLLVGVGVAGWLMINNIREMQSKELPEMMKYGNLKVPVDQRLELDRPGDYILSVIAFDPHKRSFSSPDLKITLTAEATGKKVPLNEGTKIPIAPRTLYFNISVPGAYTLVAFYPPGKTGPETVLMLQRDSSREYQRPMLMARGICLGGFLLCALLIGIAIFRFLRSKEHASLPPPLPPSMPV